MAYRPVCEFPGRFLLHVNKCMYSLLSRTGAGAIRQGVEVEGEGGEEAAAGREESGAQSRERRQSSRGRGRGRRQGGCQSGIITIAIIVNLKRLSNTDYQITFNNRYTVAIPSFISQSIVYMYKLSVT